MNLLFLLLGASAISTASTKMQLDNGNNIDAWTFQTENGAYVTRILGQYDDVSALAKKMNINPGAVVIESDNGMQLRDNADKSQLIGQFAFVSTADQQPLAVASPKITKADLDKLRLDGHHFTHFISVSDDDVNVVGTDEDYNPLEAKWAMYATQNRISRYVDQASKSIYGADTGPNEVVFLSPNGAKRSVYGMLAGRNETFKVIDTGDDSRIRVSVTQSGLHFGAYGGNEVYSTSTMTLAQYLHGDIQQINWTQIEVSGELEEISTNIGGGVLLLTLGNSDTPVLPVVEFKPEVSADTDTDVDSSFQLKIATQAAINATDIGEDAKVEPITRLTKVGDDQLYLASVDANGSNQAVNFGQVTADTVEPWKQQLYGIYGKAQSGDLQAQYAA